MNDVNPETLAAEAARHARLLMRGCDRAALATRYRQPGHWPFPALVLVAFDHDGAPVLLISGLAEHTKNLLVEPEAGLLFDGTGTTAPVLAGPRVTLVGRMVPAPEPHLSHRFVARHPEAAQYASFADFAIYRMAVERAHLVAGFGRIRWLEGKALLLSGEMSAGFAAAEPDLLDQFAQDTSLADAAWRLAGTSRPDGWTLTGIDPDGIEGRVGGRIVRANFSQPLADRAVMAEVRASADDPLG